MISKFLSTNFLILVLASSAAFAQDSAVGDGKAFDDRTGKPSAIVRISESGGELSGYIKRLFPEPEDEPNPKCDKCEGAQRGQPIVGMQIIAGMRQGRGEYLGGEILDPKTGNVYKSKMSLLDGGKKLEVRGYVGVPMLGRSQTWVRVD